MSSTVPTRRTVLTGFVALAAFQSTAAVAGDETLYVAKSPTCGCCGAWVAHMRAADFDVKVEDVSPDSLQALKTRLGIGPDHASCHTARIGGYFIEGHVPAEDVKKLLHERPDGLGLSVPGMPIGSPGMEMGDQLDPYDTLLVQEDGSAEVFVSHR